jgi:hypothetical protein
MGRSLHNHLVFIFLNIELMFCLYTRSRHVPSHSLSPTSYHVTFRLFYFVTYANTFHLSFSSFSSSDLTSIAITKHIYDSTTEIAATSESFSFSSWRGTRTCTTRWFIKFYGRHSLKTEIELIMQHTIF